MTIKNFLESRGWSCDWYITKSGNKRGFRSFSAKKNDTRLTDTTATDLKVRCLRFDKFKQLK
jgi:hypothetical protein